MVMRVLRKPQVQDRTGLKQATIDIKEAANEFPRRIKLGGRTVRVDRERGWISARASERPEASD